MITSKLIYQKSLDVIPQKRNIKQKKTGFTRFFIDAKKSRTIFLNLATLAPRRNRN